MFETLAPKLNGGKLPSRQGAADNSSNSNQISSTNHISNSTGSNSNHGMRLDFQRAGAEGQRGVNKAPDTLIRIPSDGDISFGPDDFLLGSDELVDLMHELDESKETEEGLSLSWSPTPPKAAVVASPPASSSQRSQTSTLSQSVSTPKTVNTASQKYANPSGQSAVNERITLSTQSSPTRSKLPAPEPSEKSRVTVSTARTSITTSTTTATSRIIVSNSQGNSSSRPEEHDTIDHRNGQSQRQSYLVRGIKDQERRSFLRSNSSPSAGSFSSAAQTRNKRRLPGPAGNLPELSPEEKAQLFQSRGASLIRGNRIPRVGSTSPNSSIKKKMKAVYQGPIDSMFLGGAWEDMIKAYGLPNYKPSTLSIYKGTAPMIEITLSDIESRKELHRGKVPYLLAMIKDFTLSEIDAAVTLLDPSGEMRGTVHITVLEQYKNNEIRIGTALALKNVSIFSPTPISHYIIITPRNIVRIFQPHPPTIILSQGSSQDRLSQKKRKLTLNSQDSHDGDTASGPRSQDVNTSVPSLRPAEHGERSNSNTSTASSKDSGSSSANVKRRRSCSPAKGDILDDNEAALLSYTPQSVINTKPALLRLSNTTARDGTSEEIDTKSTNSTQQTQEVQFQSLHQTLGGANVAKDGRTQTIDVDSTPLITLGTMTPSPAGASPANRASRSNLSSFAAPAFLRKRSSTVSQRSSSARSGSDSGAGLSSNQLSVDVTSSPESARVQLSRASDAFSSSDWPDDFEVDFADVSYGTIDLSTTEEPKGADRMGESRPGSFAASAPTFRRPANDDDDGEDDLSNLLEGLDETELYDL
ncbi:hypothetical protein BC939DRAFT_505205 [Gamsiella multidivaricata]|uniref:uncharacterized protein n=1 Tax=Gamsiella multidivaricata TaxID=101098 RepID=UPI00221F1118|nr:uncharacterized protein BC939DRAFT_505205 [Gamsiella multidivaricata]KAG0353366.1 hypothetical protein BGZ54_002275 [Gamsiella multidivaricata]KAI7820150.1 hypothetical protein BC939DRAFT_505205 [Gamsiella multidivaricata]